MISPPQDKLQVFPFWSVIKSYSLETAKVDLQAGLTVAIFAIPQAMAYAMLAKVPPIHGLYAAVVVSIIAALWGSAPHVNSGPTNSASLLTAGALISVNGVNDENLIAFVCLFTLMVGVIRLLMGIFRMGNLVHFVPESAFLGFTVGVGSMIALGQLHHLLGIDNTELKWFPAKVVEKMSRIGELNVHAVIISVLTLAIMFGFNRFAKKVPVALFAIVAGGLYAQYVSGPDSVKLVRDIKEVPTGLPEFAMPAFSLEFVQQLWAPALAVALVGLIEAVSIGQTLAIKHKKHLNFDQEFFGQGLGLIASSFFQGIPGSGSFSRSALIEQCGGQSLFANVYFGVITAISLLVIPGLLNLIPMASLAALLLFIGVKLVDAKRIKRVWRTSQIDVVVMILTCLVTVLVKIEYGIFTGVLAASLMLLNRTRVLHLEEVLPCPDGSFEEIPYTPGSRHEKSAIVALTAQGELFYGVAHELMEQLNEITLLQDPEIIVLRTRRAFYIDYSCWNAIFEFAKAFQARGGKLVLVGIDEKTRKTIRDARAHDWLPDSQLYTATGTMMESFSNAMKDASEQVDRSEICGVWQDWLDNPVVVTEEQVREIQRFLLGDTGTA